MKPFDLGVWSMAIGMLCTALTVAAGDYSAAAAGVLVMVGGLAVAIYEE